MRAPIGLRISTRRKALRISQVALAKAVQVSPSYLNLIEANKRQVGGALLLRIASELDMDIAELTGEIEHRLIHELIEAFSDPVLADTHMGPDQARQLVATAPEMALLVARLYRAYSGAVADSIAYADRLRADPLLSQLLHGVLSGITAVRSGAEILQGVPDLSADEHRRFVSSITRETESLSAIAHNLIGQFDQTTNARHSGSARREIDDFIFAKQNHFAALEDTAAALRAQMDEVGPFGEPTLMKTLAESHGVRVLRSAPSRGGHAYGYDADNRTLWFRNTVPQSTRQFQMARLLAELAGAETLEAESVTPILSSDAARRGAKRYLGSYVAGAILFPYESFLRDAQALRYDVDALSERYNASFEQVAHRLVTLRRTGASGIQFGFLRADPAGRLSKRFPLPGLLLPDSGHACPLWAIYAAFRSPGQLVRQVVRFPDESRFLFVARAIWRRSTGFADHSLPHSVLLIADVLQADRTVYGDGLNLIDRAADVPVGPTCRLCTRSECPSRQEDAWSPGGEKLPEPLIVA